jgi:protein-S-isoprenylcysteine O-methyltransferase Ste14
MVPFDLRIYAAHGVFWLLFAAGDSAARRRSPPASDVPTPEAPEVSAAPDLVPAGAAPLRAPRAGLLVGIHLAAFALMYSGVGRAVFDTRLPAGSPAWRGAGAFVILAGGVLAGWARLAFASWRFRAQLDPGHRLATGGPFRWVRHPIYAGLDLLALGTAVWIPTPLTLVGALAMIVGGELRARAEEPLLERAFGEAFLAYRRRTRRFIPGIY